MPSEICPLCGNAAEFSVHYKKFICREHRQRYRFAGDSGYCNEPDCTNKGTVVEPEVRARFDWETSSIIYDVPNTNNWIDHRILYAGQRFCGIHSPSRKAERDAKKRKEKNDQRIYIQQAQKSRLDRDAAYITQLVANVQEQPLTAGQKAALGELERLARKTIGKVY